jgi:hypothetical protein
MLEECGHKFLAVEKNQEIQSKIKYWKQKHRYETNKRLFNLGQREINVEWEN